MDPLRELRDAVQEGRYELTLHAWQEAAADDLHVVDIESAVLTGSIVRTEDDPTRGSRYLVQGTASDLATPVGVVARFQPDRDAVIITVYEVKPR